MESIKVDINKLLDETILISKGKTDLTEHNRLKGVINKGFKDLLAPKSVLLEAEFIEKLKKVLEDSKKSIPSLEPVTSINLIKGLWNGITKKLIEHNITDYKIHNFITKKGPMLLSKEIKKGITTKDSLGILPTSTIFKFKLSGSLDNKILTIKTFDKDSFINYTANLVGGKSDFNMHILLEKINVDPVVAPPPAPTLSATAALSVVQAATRAATAAATASTSLPSAATPPLPPASTSSAATDKSSNIPGGDLDFTLENLMKGFYYQNK
jgi:hypothetical protein